MTTIYVFKEYSGPEFPELPFPCIIDKEKSSLANRDEHVFKTNVKVFEKDPKKREIIKYLFTNAGFILITDVLITPRKDGPTIYCYDRLIFESSGNNLFMSRLHSLGYVPVVDAIKQMTSLPLNCSDEELVCVHDFLYPLKKMN